MKVRKVTFVAVSLLALLGAGSTAQAFTHLSQENHGSTGLTGAYQQYWNNYSGHSAQVIAKNGPSDYKHATANNTATARISTSFGQYVWFYHWDD